MNFPIFIVCLDKNIFCEFKNGQYRCKRCRKYLKLNYLTCIHSNTCRTFYNFKKKETTYEFLDGGYKEFFEDEEEGILEEEDDYKTKLDEILEKKNLEKKE